MTDEESCNDTEVLDEEPRSILLGLISQLRKGMDLHRVTLPTFVLEPRSMLERITDFMSHPELILSVSKEKDPVERFVNVVRYYLSGWHIKPKGVKKPYNPVLGEHFRARWQFSDNTEALFVSEQVSHHPPISAYYYASPENNIIISGDIRPKSKFLGNSAATLMQGESKIFFTNLPGEVYRIAMPNVYARGILFGRMVLELGDNSTVKCEKNDLGFFTGAYNSIYGKIKRESTGESLYEITGKWSDTMYIKDLRTGHKEVLFNVHESKIYPKIVTPEEEQEENESRRLWSKVTNALIGRNLDLATEEKTLIEDNQRNEAKLREAEGIDWRPRFFLSENDEFKFKQTSHLSKDPQGAKHQIESFIFSSNSPPGFHSPNGPYHHHDD
ncbi:8767_t:CDS:2 [Funneliformis geosporum]|uniref:9782_t:CDS:1 n=1 Tax=Funneliformis geosporum TaxID=1117311 RepID=A0A9W4SSF4_9GLOM|nr:8767_t:CDS:2 [Funneliformis geosporum]CAI2179195.1 9782_t:CDS:2 [Funneliformis geosporum]